MYIDKLEIIDDIRLDSLFYVRKVKDFLNISWNKNAWNF